MNQDSRFVTAKELAHRYGISVPTVYKLLHAGLPSFTIGRARRFDTEMTDEWISRPQVAA